MLLFLTEVPMMRGLGLEPLLATERCPERATLVAVTR
jgi:hypothetical protein